MKKPTKLQSEIPATLETVPKPKTKSKAKKSVKSSKKGLVTGDGKTKERQIPDVDTSFPSSYNSQDDDVPPTKRDDRNVFILTDQDDKWDCMIIDNGSWFYHNIWPAFNNPL